MMNYTTLNIGEETYKLRLNIRAMCEIEKKLGDNPINVLIAMEANTRLPNTQALVIILHEALQTYNHGIKMEDTYNLLDKYLDEGHQYSELLTLVMDVFKTSGIVNDGKEENPN